MATRYVSSKTTRFVEDPGSSAEPRNFKLLYGDEISTIGQPAAGKQSVIYRDRTGQVPAEDLGTFHPLEIYFIDVGQGDSSFIVTPGGKKILIDGGAGDEAFQFLVWKYRLDLPNAKPVAIDLLVVSHTDLDHLQGLSAIVKHGLINVKQIIHPGIAKYKKGAFKTGLGDTSGSGAKCLLITSHDKISEIKGQPLADAMKSWRKTVAGEPGVKYRAVDHTSGEIDIGEPAVTLTVLGPLTTEKNGKKAFKWLGNDAHTVNGHSVVLRLDYGKLRVLFPGDVNIQGSNHLMDQASFPIAANSHVLKAPHHGSHEFTQDFLRAVGPQVTVISSGDGAKTYGHPRANFLGEIGLASRAPHPLVFSTELTANFIVDKYAAEDVIEEVPADPTDPALLGHARLRFIRHINGLINVRSDGEKIFCARRVAGGQQFDTYEVPIAIP